MKAKDNLGLVKTIAVTYDYPVDSSIDKQKLRSVKKALSALELEVKNETDAPGIKLVEYNANYIIRDWDWVENHLEEALPEAEIKFFDGVYNEETDDFQYTYESLHVLIK